MGVKRQDLLRRHLGNPAHVFSVDKGKPVPKALSEYVDWVKRHFDIDDKGKKLTQRAAAGVQNTGSSSTPGVCDHGKVHHRGSSARFIRTTCCKCGELLSNVERSPATVNPREYQHRRTDHRGSNKYVRNTFCLDCGSSPRGRRASFICRRTSAGRQHQRARHD